MAELQPFNGVLYNPDRVDPSSVLTQPYDKISPELQATYLARSPYNLVQIELGETRPTDTDTENKYTRARDLYQAWQEQGILRRSTQPALYYLEQSFASPIAAGTRHTRCGLIARVRLSRWDEGKILPHEHTLSKPKADRMSLLKACGSQQGQIFMTYPAPQKRSLAEIVKGRLGQPVLTAIDDYQVTNTLYELTDPALLAEIQAEIGAQTFYIADGHHRYETALAFRDECRAANPDAGPNAPWEFLMTTLVDMSDPGLVVLPTHRLVGNLPDFDSATFLNKLGETFEITPTDSLEDTLASLEQGPHVLGLYSAAGFARLRLRDAAGLAPLFADKPPLWNELDVAILHVAILEALLGIDEEKLRDQSHVSYWREAEQACQAVDRGEAPLLFLLKATPVTDVQKISDARSRMRRKRARISFPSFSRAW